ncbi:hypothetical protein C4D60_Mb11t19340 [Musa balbisiana]|uniref:RING-type E3 ubiquitin transferase n=1 Tax=Musa balbisiana TaxID=52838 RepID=A0A4S8J586_MUSBA|nr:hypothetical protein C4D60_Mb11t19340 [Musa balbisiana]
MSMTTRPPSPGRGAGIDRTPLLGVAHRSGWSASLRGSARFLRRTSGRRMIRAPSVNLTFIGIVVGVLILSWHDTQSMPFRLWIFGYVLQCVLHMVCVCVGYRRRHPPEGAVVDVEVGGGRAQIHRGRWKNLMTMSRTKTMIGLGASEQDVHQLPKYKFHKVGDSEKLEMSGPSGGIMTECGSDPLVQHVLLAEDAECCICLWSCANCLVVTISIVPA